MNTIIEKIRAEVERLKKEQPVCEGLEEEIRSYLMTNRIVNHSEMGWKRWGEQIARHFAQWGAEHLAEK